MQPNEQKAFEGPQHGSEVTITYNDVPTVIHRGNYSVAELRNVLQVPPTKFSRNSLTAHSKISRPVTL